MNMIADIVSTEKELFTGEIKFLSAPAIMGEIGVLPGHAPLLTKLKPGSISITVIDDTMEHIFVSGGILEIQPHRVTILADTGIRAADLDEAAILAAKSRAEELMQNRSELFDLAETEAKLAEAINQLRTLEKYRSSRK
jgi:F-type H+-transporting ATPase subunit epsilon